MANTVRQDVTAVERRLSEVGSMTRLMAGVQRTSLAKAERLRRAALDVIESSAAGAAKPWLPSHMETISRLRAVAASGGKTR